jgi:ribosome-binding protein aMBF1 (putative translation factor)
MTRKTARELHDELYNADPEYTKEYDALAEEFALADEVIRARSHANLTQVELAKKMDTTQAQIARIEGGKMPSIRTLERLAAATGTQLKVSFEALPNPK